MSEQPKTSEDTSKFSAQVVNLVEDKTISLINTLKLHQSNVVKTIIQTEMFELVAETMDAWNHHLSRIREQKVCDTTIIVDSVTTNPVPDITSSDTSKDSPEQEQQ